jgi:hypothetical protein
MPVNLRARVVALGSDSDPFTGQAYTAVTLATESPIPRALQQLPNAPRPTVYKHVLHIFIPNDQWNSQYNMWTPYDVLIEDSGEMRLVPARENR